MTIPQMDQQTREILELTGESLEQMSPDAGMGNGLKIRRIMQIIQDLAKKQKDPLRVLDLGCARGLYSIETALRGATVKGIDARLEWMGKGIEAGKRLKLNNLSFEQNDIRSLTKQTHGTFDIIYFMGVLYRLDVPDSLHVMENLSNMCEQFMIVDTHVCDVPQSETTFKGKTYQGIKSREHDENDSLEVRHSKLEKSIDNAYAFIFTKESLLKLLYDNGFTSVLECHIPYDRFKPMDRVTLIAMKGSPVKISTYPWLNDLNEDEIEEILLSKYGRNLSVKPRSIKKRIGDMINKCLRLFGFELRPVQVDESVNLID